jgi:tetratricopeptide (TPR) repeat protein
MHAHHEALAMTNLGVLQFAEGCYHESQDLLKKALERHQEYSKQLAEDQALGAISLTSLSIQIKKDLSLAKHPVNERNLVSQLNEYSTLDAMIADLLNNLAACHEVIGEMADAQKFFEESLQLRMIVYGKESLKVAETMQNLATILDSQGKYVESENYLRQALSIETKELGEDHIETAVTMNNLGVLLAHLEKYGESRELLERSVQLRETFYGPHNHLTVCARQNLDFVLSKLTDETPKP